MNSIFSLNGKNEIQKEKESKSLISIINLLLRLKSTDQVLPTYLNSGIFLKNPTIYSD